MATGIQSIPRAPGPVDRGVELLAVLSVVMALAWVFVLLRAYVRYYMIKSIAADDWWMFAAMIAYTGYGAVGIYGIIYGGTGRHMTELTTGQIYIGLKTWYIAELFYAPVSAMVRTSVALFLLRVSVVRWHRWIIYVNLAIIYLITVIFLFVATFQCDPPSYFYDQVLGLEGHCLEITVVPFVTIAHSSICAVCDLIYAWLPIAMLWNVQLNKRTKIVVAILLGMGSVAGLALIVRIPFIRVLAVSPDFLFETIDVAIWSVMEPSLGIMAGCLATLRPLFKGFGIGRNVTRGYLDRYMPGSSTLGRSNGGNKSFRLNKSSGGVSPSTMEIELSSPGFKDDAASIRTHSSTRPLRIGLEPSTSPLSVSFLRPSVRTNIMSNRDLAAAHHTTESGSQAISVHTIIRTESIYEGIQPIREE